VEEKDQPMKIILSDINPAITDAYERFCGDLKIVEVNEGSILDLPCDAVVSPANSYGFMDGGIDLAYSQFFGWGVQEKLQHQIRNRYQGELLVGQAEIVETGKPQIPFLIAAPTMRVPMKLENTVNVYLAVRVVFQLIKHGVFSDGPLTGEPISKHVQSVAFPGMGTGVGQVGPNTCAQQMRSAIDRTKPAASPVVSTARVRRVSRRL
jgi:O-acetyl-ADP-ribose deacetylase (regulator of RNase III)